MSSTREIISDAEIEALEAEIMAISSNKKMRAKPALESLLLLIKASIDVAPIDILHKWLSLLKSSQAVERINASDMEILQTIEIFGLKTVTDSQWLLVEDNLLNVPPRLVRNLSDLRYALHNIHSEATCRIAVDIILVHCRKYLRNKYESAETSQSVEANVSSTLTKAVVNMLTSEQMQQVMLFAEATISVEIRNKSVPNSKFLVTGRADWAMGYNTTGDEGALLIAIEAKKRSEFSKGEAQLIAYLAILRENRIRAKKTNITTQGFYSDGSRFAFICITADGAIEQSAIFEIAFEGNLKRIFNFIVTMMETAMKSTLNATLTKPGLQQEKEINHYKDEVWTKVYALMDEALAVDPDDETDVSDI